MENGYNLIERLRKGEKIKCEGCKKGYYVTNAKSISLSHEFKCNNCSSVLRVSPNITVE